MLLFRTFLKRFFENELTSGADDLRLVFFTGIAMLAVPGVVAPVLMAGAAASADPSTWGWAMVARTAGVDALRQMALHDKALYLGFAMIVSGLLGAITWNSLVPDRRDTLVLGGLPVRPSSIVLAKLGALFAYTALVAIAIHALSSLAFGLLLAAGNTPAFALRGIAAHFVASVGASTFVTLLLVSFQGVLLAAGGPRAFARSSPVLQFGVVALTLVGVVGLPAASRTIADAWRHGGDPAAIGMLAMPLQWFLGVYEGILGPSDPAVTTLAARAVAMLAATAAVTFVTYPLAYHRLVIVAIERPAAARRRRPFGRRVVDVVVRLISREPGRRAVASFYFATLTRGPRQRLVLTTALGAAMAWGLPAWMAMSTMSPAALAAPSLGVVTWPIASMLFVLVGLRAAAALPADLPAVWMFDSAPVSPKDVRATVERAMFLLGVVPIGLTFSLVYGRWWGLDAAVTHAVTVAAVGTLLIRLLLWRSTDVPSTRASTLDSEHIRAWWPLYLVVFLAFMLGVPAIEYLSFGRPIVTTFAVIWYVAVAAIVRAYTMRARAGAREDRSAEILSTALRVGRSDVAVEDDADARVGVPHDRPMFARPTSRLDEDHWFDDWSLRPREIGRDALSGWRRLRRAPGFALFAIGTLALAIGATTASYALLRAFTAPGFVPRDPDAITIISSRATTWLSWPDYEDLVDRQTSFDAIGASSDFPGAIAWNGRATLAEGQLIAGDYFRALGIDAAQGRMIQAADDRPEAPPVVVLADALWRTTFGADPSVIGATVHIADELYQVVGIAPASFRGLQVRNNRAPWFFVAHAHAPLTDRAVMAHRDPQRRDRAYLHVVGRLRQDVDVRAARAQVETIGRALDVDVPFTARADGRVPKRSWVLNAIDDDSSQRQSDASGRRLLIVPVIILLIASTNLANLVLSRGEARRRESAVRRALGATRWSLIREQVVELGLIGLAGAATAFVLARVFVAGFIQFLRATYGAASQYQLDVPVHWSSIAVATASAVVAVLIAGLLPAIQLSRGSLAAMSNDGAQGTPRWRGRARLIAGQVAATVVLLLLAALSVRSLMESMGAGQQTLPLDRLAVAAVPFSLQARDEVRVIQAIDDITRGLRESTGATQIAVVSRLPEDRDSRTAIGSLTQVALSRPGEPLTTGRSPVNSGAFVQGSSTLFDTLGIAIVRGRAFDDRDVAGVEPVMVVNERYAVKVFGTTDVVGREVAFRSFDANTEAVLRRARIVGVVADTTSSQTDKTIDVAYVPIVQQFEPDVLFVVRGEPDALQGLVTGLRTAIRRVDASLAIAYAGGADVLVGANQVVLGLVARVTGSLALVALMLAMSGLYGVLSHVVQRRTREMGIRLALGASPADIVRLIVGEGLRPVGVGVAVGIGIATLARMSAQPFFVRLVQAIDPMAMVIAIMPMAVAAGLACYLPARRAAGTSPSVALRDEGR